MRKERLDSCLTQSLFLVRFRGVPGHPSLTLTSHLPHSLPFHKSPTLRKLHSQVGFDSFQLKSNTPKMRATAFLVSFLVALATAAPEMTMEKRTERIVCDCDEDMCRGPPCCDNGTCWQSIS
ncbi:uncharacterized protein B0T15DRAFT_543679 [Chaetomium strumarium]|uniref:Uncharacterized protein n=1 Tax=Chaetomium strumarium TaxID=1170767 RepID=A0AAJ0LYU7_9PEZI|nr:hypothetical protein B0T15DRAFT_543679 [Chaetomium strumarium]